MTCKYVYFSSRVLYVCSSAFVFSFPLSCFLCTRTHTLYYIGTIYTQRPSSKTNLNSSLCGQCTTILYCERTYKGKQNRKNISMKFVHDCKLVQHNCLPHFATLQHRRPFTISDFHILISFFSNQ